MRTSTEENESIAQPAFPSFWAHGRYGCFEVPAGENSADYLAAEPQLFGESSEAAHSGGWISAERRTGNGDYWLVRCGTLQQAVRILEVWTQYIPERFPSERDTLLRIQSDEGVTEYGPIARATAKFVQVSTSRLPGSPGVVLLEVKNLFDQYCLKPHERAHHATLPGLWIHPRKGEVEVLPGTHHADTFTEHPEVFGDTFEAAYRDGWVGIRRWTGYRNQWIIRYGDLELVLPALTQWARSLVAQHPEEAYTPIQGIPAFERQPLTGTVANLAEGKSLTKDGGQAYLPPPESLHQHCQEQSEGMKVIRGEPLPWPDFGEPEEKAFVALHPARGAKYFRLGNLQHELDEARAQFAKCSFVFGRQAIFERTQRLESWIHQIQTGEAPTCVGDGYREWLAYLRKEQVLNG